MSGIEITKEHVGRTIYALPTGNNARRGVAEQAHVKFDVVGFGRKYAKVLIHGREVSMCPKSGAYQESINSGYGNNAGYLFFDNEHDVATYQKDLKERKEADSLLRSYSATSRLSMETIRKIIAELSEVE